MKRDTLSTKSFRSSCRCRTWLAGRWNHEKSLSWSGSVGGWPRFSAVGARTNAHCARRQTGGTAKETWWSFYHVCHGSFVPYALLYGRERRDGVREQQMGKPLQRSELHPGR